MALCALLALIAVQALCANGFGFQVAPFQMELQLPAGGPGPSFSPFGGPSPLMSMMSFPPIFNPMEAMGREEMDADARMDVNGGPMGNVTTKNKTESKGGYFSVIFGYFLALSSDLGTFKYFPFQILQQSILFCY